LHDLFAQSVFLIDMLSNCGFPKWITIAVSFTYNIFNFPINLLIRSICGMRVVPGTLWSQADYKSIAFIQSRVSLRVIVLLIVKLVYNNVNTKSKDNYEIFILFLIFLIFNSCL